MSFTSSSSGRALALLLGLLAVAAIVWLVLGNPFAGGDTDGNGAGDGGPSADLLTGEGEGETDLSEGAGAVATLAGRYGEGDLGAIRIRLLWIGSRAPLAGQSVQLLSRRGTEVTKTPTDAAGVALFPMVRPTKGYQLHVKGEGFSEVLIRGITVRDQATTDVGDVLVGEDIVLRGRVVDVAGRPVPGSSVSIRSIERRLASKGFIFFIAEQARSVPPPLKQVTSDDAGYFAFSQVENGTYSLVARRSGFGSKHEADVVVARERGAAVLTVVLGQAGHVNGKVTTAEGKPVAGAQVVAIRDTRRMTTNMIQREVAVTGDDGRYVLDTLTAGVSYRFGVVAEGYAPVYEIQGVEIGDADMERNFELVVGGHLSGVVLDEETGQPVDGAKVAVYVGSFGFGRGRGDRNARAAADTRTTDDKGRFRFEALTPGPVATAVIKAPGYVTGSYSMWPPPGNSWADVVAGETTEVEAKLRRGGTIRGSVKTAENGAPIQGAEVTVMATGMAAFGSMWVGSPSAVTSADGAFELAGVTPGKYRVHAVADGFSPAGGEKGVEVEVPKDGGIVERNVSLSAAGTVQGVVKDPAGEPIAGVRIRVRPHTTGGGGGRRGLDFARRLMMAGRRPTDLSDEQGVFQLQGVSSSGEWVVVGESEEYVSGESKPFKVAAGAVKKLALEMLPGGALRGRVVDENGRWLPGVRVRVGRLDDELAKQRNLSGWRADRALDPRVFTSDEEGRFLATNLKPGRTIVKATKDGYITFYKRNVTIKPGETVDNYTVALSAGEIVEGTVSGADGRPLEGAMVALTAQDDPGSRAAADEESGEEPSDSVEASMFSRADSDGRYQIENVPPGTYNVVIWFAPGHKGWGGSRDESAIRREITVPARDVDFKLVKAEPFVPGMPGGGGR